MRKKDLVWEYWERVCKSYYDAKINLIEAIRKAENLSDGLELLNRYTKAKPNLSTTLVFAEENKLRDAIHNRLSQLADLGYIKLPEKDERVEQFLEGKTGRPFVDQ
jgi:hypothetical protein